VLSAGGSIPSSCWATRCWAWALAGLLACPARQSAAVELVLYNAGGRRSCSKNRRNSLESLGPGHRRSRRNRLALGFDDPPFALACAVAFVVMYDANRVRYAAGLQAKLIQQPSGRLCRRASVNQPTDPSQRPTADLSDKLPVTAAATAAFSRKNPGHTRRGARRQPDRSAIALCAGLGRFPPADRPGLGLASHRLSARDR